MFSSKKLLFSGFSCLAYAMSVSSISAGEGTTSSNDKPEHGWSMADDYWDKDEMARSRAAVQKEHGATETFFVQADRLEYRSNEGNPVGLWDLQGWYGGDINKLWIKTEGEYSFEEDTAEDAEIQALWSRSIARYFDLQTGIRHDFEPGPSRTFGVIGVQGLAPYMFEVDAAAFFSEDGDASIRVEAEYEILLTQRLILQPRTELNFEFQDVPEYELGSGLSKAEAGLRLRYEIKRELAPYVGISWERAYGDTAEIIRASGEDVTSVSLVAGLRAWF